MALHRFRARALSPILRSPLSIPDSHAPPIFSFARLFCSAAATTESSVSKPSPFAAEDYLVSRCGLTRAQAVKASKKISHFTSHSKPDAVLAFLRGTLGIPAADVAAFIAKHPSFLSIDVERTLAPRVVDLLDFGLSRDDIVRLIPRAPNCFRSRALRRNLEFWIKELGSVDKVLMMSSNLLSAHPDKVTEPNVAFLRQYGLSVSDVVACNIYFARLFTMNPNVVREAVETVEELGVKPGSRSMLARTLFVISWMGKEFVTGRIQLLQKSGFSEDEVLEMVRKVPYILGSSDKRLQQNMDFLTKDVGLDFTYIARRPVLLSYSVEHRLSPRHCLLEALREKGLLKTEVGYYSASTMAEKDFRQKFVIPYKDIVPDLADDFASKCSRKAVDRIGFARKLKWM